MALSWGLAPAGLPRRLTGGQVRAGVLWRGGGDAERRLPQAGEDELHKGRGEGGPAGLGELGWKDSILGPRGIRRRTL